MKKLLLLLLPAITIFFFTSCKKNYAEEHYTEIVNPVIPDFITLVTAGVNGFITDENGNAVEGAAVKAGAVTVSTDQFGYFTISAASFAKAAGFVQVSKSGYFTGYRTFLPVAGKETFTRLQIIPKVIAGNIDATAGGSVTTTDGAIINLPADAVVNASTNSAYSGIINVAAHWLDPSSENTQLTMPGNLTGVDSEGHLNVLATYGMLAVELTGSGGETLQIASGKKASLRFPIPASLSATAPASIPLWYFDETKGVWKKEGNAVKNGNNYEGNVSHFTYWNCDVGFPLVNFSVQVVDNDLSPISNTAVSVSITGQVNSARIGYTDTSGVITGLVPANSDLGVEIIAPCNQRISIKNILTTNSDINLGAIKVNLQQYSAVFKGTANKCSGSPITNGFVAIKENGIYHSIKIQNGVFHSAIIVCSNTNAAITVYDREAVQQSSPQNIVVANGINDLGVISACLPVSGEYIFYDVGGVSKMFTLSEYQFDGLFSLSSNETVIRAHNLITNGEEFRLILGGGQSTGSYTPSDTQLTLGPVYSDDTYTMTPSTMITISEYGLIGQFIKGSISGTVQDLSSTNHIINCTFQIKRD